MITIKLKDVIRTDCAVFHSFAKVFLKELLYFIPFKRGVTLSFEGIESVSSLFIRNSFEVLYKRYRAEADAYLQVEDISNEIWKEKIEDAQVTHLRELSKYRISQSYFR